MKRPPVTSNPSEPFTMAPVAGSPALIWPSTAPSAALHVVPSPARAENHKGLTFALLLTPGIVAVTW